MQMVVQGARIKRLGVERPSDPLQHPSVLVVGRITDRFEERLVAPWPAAVLRRAGAASAGAHRVGSPRLSGQELLHHDLVTPVVTEVVHVEERGAHLNQIPEASWSFVPGRVAPTFAII